MMNIEREMMENQGGNLPYEQPSLKKYGTMKEFTLNSSGSSGDGFGLGQGGGGSDPKPQIINSADVTGGVAPFNDTTGNTPTDFAEVTNSD